MSNELFSFAELYGMFQNRLYFSVTVYAYTDMREGSIGCSYP